MFCLSGSNHRENDKLVKIALDSRKLNVNKTKLLGHEIEEKGIKPNTKKEKAILELKHPENQRQLESLLGAIQYLAKFISRLSE